MGMLSVQDDALESQDSGQVLEDRSCEVADRKWPRDRAALAGSLWTFSWEWKSDGCLGRMCVMQSQNGSTESRGKAASSIDGNPLYSLHVINQALASFVSNCVPHPTPRLS